MTTTPATPVQLLRTYTIAGYLPHWQQPLAILELSVQSGHDAATGLAALHLTLTTALPDLSLTPPPVTATPLQLGSYVLDCLRALLARALFPQLTPPRCETLIQADGRTLVVLLLPLLSTGHSAPIVVAELLVRLVQGHEPVDTQRRLTQAMQALTAQRPTPGTAVRLLQAALAAGIPWFHINQNIYQFGWGRASSLFDSSFTEHTSNISTRLARHKFRAASVLRQAGLPVPQHEMVNSPQEAESAAARLGYPVVVKPADLDKGVGVAANLKHPAAVVAAWHAAKKHSHRILVEKHIEGRDFRVIVLDGKILTVNERVPACVIGDGRRDIKTLLHEVNRDPRRQAAAQRFVQIALDDEALSLLSEQQLQVDSIPAEGRQVRLRRTANIATGGTPAYIALDQVHPDNLLLCVRAAAALRLDLAGVDFLIADISKSWRDTGGGICEVNSQPQMQPELPGHILRQRVSGQGRIPVVAIVAAETAPWWREVENTLVQRGIALGVADTAGVRLNGATIAATTTVVQAASILLREPTLAAALFVVTTPAQLREGAPTDKLDLLVLSTATPSPAMLQLLQARSATLWCIDSQPLLPRHSDSAPVVLTPDSLAPALLAFLETRV